MLYPPVPQKLIHQTHVDSAILRVVSINVNGLRASHKKGLFDWIATSDADVICMQETRLTHEQWDDKFKPQGWHYHLFAAQRLGYSGTAIYSKLPFVSVIDGLGFELADTEGRFTMVQLDLSAFSEQKPLFIASLYLPSGSSGDDAQARKDLFLHEYQAILQRWRDEDKSLIVCGDYNMVHKKIDIKNFSGNQKSSGCLPHERAWLDYAYEKMGYVDSFRRARTEADLYSWWSNRGKARENNVGWRIDYQMCSPNWAQKVLGAWVYREKWFSDHAPVIVDYLLN